MIRRLVLLVHGFLTLLLVLSLHAPAWAQEPDQPAPTPPTAQEEKSVEPAQPEKKAEPGSTDPDQASGMVIPPTEKNGTPAPVDESASPEAPKEPAKGNKPESSSYVVKPGDTLWDISNAFLKDPFLWPFIWKANPSITNADLIYPGNKLTIPSMAPIERAMQSPEQAAKPELAEKEVQNKEAPAAPQEVKSAPTATQPAEAANEETPAPSRLILPEEKPIPIIDKYSMLSAGFVGEEQNTDKIVGSLEPKTIFGYDDIVYVSVPSAKDAALGDKFLIYDALGKVKHPVTGKVYGRLIKICGILQLIEKGKNDTFKARIIYSFDAADMGSLLTPYQEPTLIYNTGPAKKKDLNGYVLEVMDGRTINAQIDVLYLDKGSDDGVEPGDRFIVYEHAQGKYPRTPIGEAQVILVKKRTATAIVRKSTDTIAKGYVVEYENP